MGKTSRIPFTKSRLLGLPVPASGRRYWYDEKTPELAVCVTSAGTRTLYVYKRMGGKPTRYRLGRFPELPVEQARKLAAEVVVEEARGKNPQTERRAARNELTIEELFDFWLTTYAKPRKKTWKEDERLYEKFLKPWANRSLSAISKRDVEKLHAQIGGSNGPYQANRVLELIRAAYVRARKKLDWQGPNPAEDIDAFEEKSRDRYLLPEELPRFFKAMEAEPALTRDFFLLCLYTGGRRSNVQAMRWDELQDDYWRIPETKSGKPVLVPLVPQASAILESRRKTAGGSPWVFPTRRGSKSGHIQEPKRAWKNLIERAGLVDLRLHDLRRTLGSWQAATGASLPIIGKMLGHGAGSRATEVYARLHLDPVREAATKATNAMIEAANGKGEEDGVV